MIDSAMDARSSFPVWSRRDMGSGSYNTDEGVEHEGREEAMDAVSGSEKCSGRVLRGADAIKTTGDDGGEGPCGSK